MKTSFQNYLKFIVLLFLFCLAGVTYAQVNNKHIPLFKYRTYCGHCSGDEGYREISIDSNQMVRSITHVGQYPRTYRDTIHISSNEWENLIRSIELKAFFALPERIGCPGCNDLPSQSIEIYYLRKKHKTWFDNSQSIY